MKTSTLVAALVILSASPAFAQTSIRGVELTATDAARVQRQCDVLKIKEMRSMASEPPEEPLAGETVTDPAGYWADTANAADSALSRINLDTLTLRDCRKAGFY